MNASCPSSMLGDAGGSADVGADADPGLTEIKVDAEQRKVEG